jgi:hypothetical protein
MDYLGYQHLGYQKTLPRGRQGTFSQWQQSSLSGERLSLGHSRELSISVEGDLSAEELEDISKAVKAVDKMMQGLLFNDPNGQGVAGLDELGLDTLAGIKADYSYTREVQVQSLTHEQQQSSRQGLLPSHGLGKVRGRFMERLGQLMDPAVRDIKAAGIEPQQLEKPVDRLFQGYKNRLDSTDSRYQQQKEFLVMVQETFFQHLDAQMEVSLNDPS